MQNKIKLIFFFLMGILFSHPYLSHAGNTSSFQNIRNKRNPILLKADSIVHDHETGITQAKGHVLFFRGKEVLEADVVTYNHHTNMVVATGNVILTQKSLKRKKKGETVFFANEVELTSDLKKGFIKKIRAILSDDAKFVALSGKKEDKKSRFHNARYSPCKVCRETKRPVLWQLNAKTVTWLEEEHDIVYTDAVMELWNLPVFYLPYFRHPDPSVKRRSGFLAPNYAHNNTLGVCLQTPYFYEIAQDQDITMTPLLTKKGGQFLETHYRYAFPRGYINMKGSGGKGPVVKISSPQAGKRKGFPEEEKNRFQGHIDSEVLYKIDENWRFKGNILKVTGKTYLNKYPFYGHTSAAFLPTKALLEGFYPRTYVRVKTQHTQSTREQDRQRRIPLIIPAMDINYESRPQKWGSWWNIDGNILWVQRRAGQNTRRGVASVGWSVPWYGWGGDRFTLNLVARGDIYDTSNTSEDSRKDVKKEPHKSFGRFFPQAKLLWELPFYRNFPKYTAIIGPEISFITSPISSNRKKFPNEDNYLSEPTDSSLFNLNRLQGYDRLDEGTRITYGLKGVLYQSNIFHMESFLGQTYHFTHNKELFTGTGFEDKESDLVGRFNAHILKYLDLRFRFRLDKETLHMQRNELGVSMGGHFFKMHIDYLFLPPKLIDETTTNALIKQKKNNKVAGKQVQVGFVTNPHENWRFTGVTLQALGDNQQSLGHRANIEYHNECLTIDFSLTKTYYRNLDLKPDTTCLARITFKNLGTIVTPRFGFSGRHDHENHNDDFQSLTF